MNADTFFLKSPHIHLAHHLWKNLLQKGDRVVDATCGNGKDTLFLAQNALSEHKGALFAFDVQKEAIGKSRSLLQSQLNPEIYHRVHFFHSCHSDFSAIAPKSIRLIIYNLGYLPGGNKTLTTKTDTTLASLYHAQKLLLPKGAFSITSYPGHEEGNREEKTLLEYFSSWNPMEWSISHYRWHFRETSPSLFWIKKNLL